MTSLFSSYLTALDAEARLYRDQFPGFDSLFLGGGTPSLLTGPQIAALMEILRRHFAFAPDSEITIEANPDDITADKLALWRDLGINRLSLGVQSFDEAELRFLGRRHTARQTEAALALIRAAGFTNLGLDLMYGLPGQSLEAWTRTLETALSFTPEHLSGYQLTYGGRDARRTPLARRAARGELSLPDEEAQREFFLLTANFLKARGYRHYEVANFARQEKLSYCCRHNLKYWTRTPYLGLGPGSHSFQGGRRWWNVASVGDYCASLQRGKPRWRGPKPSPRSKSGWRHSPWGSGPGRASVSTPSGSSRGGRQAGGAYPGRPGPGGPRPGHRHGPGPGGGRPPAPVVYGLRPALRWGET